MDLIATLRSFLQVSEIGSFSAVAAERGMTQPAISRQVTALEEFLGARLVHRTTHSVCLTDEGREFLPVIQNLVDQVDALASSAASRRNAPMGAVRIAVSVAFGVYLGKHLHRLLDKHEVNGLANRGMIE